MNKTAVVFRTRVLILRVCIVCFFFSACGDNDIILEPEVIKCDDTARIDNIVSELGSSNFVAGTSQGDGILVLDLHIGSSIKLEYECIEKTEEFIEKSELRIFYSDGRILILPFLNNILHSYIHNPNGKTPLSGELVLNAALPGKLSFKIPHKDEDGEVFGFQFKAGATGFRVPILGLFYNHQNQIILEFRDEENLYLRDTIVVGIGQRPNYLPSIIVDIYDPNKTEPGMHFVSFRGRVPSTPFILDNSGEYRYVLDFSSDPELAGLNYDVGMERLKNGNYYFGNWPSPLLYEMDVLGHILSKWNIGPFEFHHNVQEKEDGNLLATVSRYDMHSSGRRAIEDWIIEIDRNTGSLIHSWDLKKSLNDARQVMGWYEWQDIVDWAHANAVIHDPRDNTIIVSCRTQALVKLDYSNRPVWILGNHKAWGKNGYGEELDKFLLQPLDKSGNAIDDQLLLQGEKSHPEFEWPWYQHAPLLMDNGHIMLFDNGANRNFAGFGEYSRAVEYEIDESSMTVQQIWQYGKERGRSCFSAIVSDVDILEQSGNVYFCPGSRVNNDGGNFGGKIVEVSYPDKNVVFEMRINAPDIVFHRAEKMALYPDQY